MERSHCYSNQVWHFQSMLVVRWTQINLPKSVLHIQSFCFCLLNLLLFRCSHFCCHFGCAELISSFTIQNNSWFAMISPENLTIWWKMCVEINVCRYPYGSSYLVGATFVLLFFKIVIMHYQIPKQKQMKFWTKDKIESQHSFCE